MYLCIAYKKQSHKKRNAKTLLMKVSKEDLIAKKTILGKLRFVCDHLEAVRSDVFLAKDIAEIPFTRGASHKITWETNVSEEELIADIHDIYDQIEMLNCKVLKNIVLNSTQTS